MGNDANGAAPPSRRTAVAIAIAVACLVAPAGAAAGAIRSYRGVAGHGQYLDLSISADGATVSMARIRERCRPGGRHQLVQPNVVGKPMAVGEGGRFARTFHRGSAKTRYRGFVNGGTVTVKVFDSGDRKCDGATQRFVTRLIK